MHDRANNVINTPHPPTPPRHVHGACMNKTTTSLTPPQPHPNPTDTFHIDVEDEDEDGAGHDDDHDDDHGREVHKTPKSHAR